MKLRLRSFIPAAFFFIHITSCITVDNRMGSDLLPVNQIIHIYTADFEAPMFTAVADSLNMSHPRI